MICVLNRSSGNLNVNIFICDFSFKKLVRHEAGYAVDWERFSRSDVGRDLLYIACDLSVNELAKPRIQHENTLCKILYTQTRLAGNRDLPDLLHDAV